MSEQEVLSLDAGYDFSYNFLELCVGIVSCVSISNYCEIGKKNSKKAKIIVFAINILSKTAGHYGIIALLNCFCDNESQ